MSEILENATTSVDRNNVCVTLNVNISRANILITITNEGKPLITKKEGVASKKERKTGENNTKVINVFLSIFKPIPILNIRNMIVIINNKFIAI